MKSIIDPTPKITEIGIKISIEIRKSIAKLTTRDISHWIDQFATLLQTDGKYDSDDKESHTKCLEILKMGKAHNVQSVEVENKYQDKKLYIQITIWFNNMDDFRNFSEKM